MARTRYSVHTTLDDIPTGVVVAGIGVTDPAHLRHLTADNLQCPKGPLPAWALQSATAIAAYKLPKRHFPNGTAFLVPLPTLDALCALALIILREEGWDILAPQERWRASLVAETAQFRPHPHWVPARIPRPETMWPEIPGGIPSDISFRALASLCVQGPHVPELPIAQRVALVAHWLTQTLGAPAIVTSVLRTEPLPGDPRTLLAHEVARLKASRVDLCSELAEPGALQAMCVWCERMVNVPASWNRAGDAFTCPCGMGIPAPGVFASGFWPWALAFVRSDHLDALRAAHAASPIVVQMEPSTGAITIGGWAGPEDQTAYINIANLQKTLTSYEHANGGVDAWAMPPGSRSLLRSPLGGTRLSTETVLATVARLRQ